MSYCSLRLLCVSYGGSVAPRPWATTRYDVSISGPEDRRLLGQAPKLSFDIDSVRMFIHGYNLRMDPPLILRT
ncbi:hypothetical protein PISMIDRAFT_671778 [Pisolithus microcarpus 441]|uniref:Uncharacterized protein n=1 Tax=Pisolithus microcarpus 441 TaxID=765257 RepID=A0A0C9ZUX1_9AGAM|nr:hypothetical protein PISMIDRAFT_671778 [Pisolithus microcarpus 441]